MVGATVTLTSRETNRTQQTRSGEGGYYRFDRLPPGSYVLTAELSGFKRAVLEQVEVRAEEGVVVETHGSLCVIQLATESPSVSAAILA